MPAGTHAVVTGASRGIGAAAAHALAEAGAAISLLGRDASRVAAVAAEIEGEGGNAAAQSCDVSDYAALSRALDDARRRFGPVGALINNAGVVEPIARIAEADPAIWARNIEIDLVGAFYAVRAVLSEMLAAGAGTIVNVSSGAAHRALEGWSAHCAAKAGFASLTRSLALEYGAAGLRVFGFSPGTTDTDMQAVIRASGINPVSRIPRETLTPVDVVAHAIVYLCTAAADDLSGSEIALSEPEFRRRVGLG